MKKCLLALIIWTAIAASLAGCKAKPAQAPTAAPTQAAVVSAVSPTENTPAEPTEAAANSTAETEVAPAAATAETAPTEPGEVAPIASPTGEVITETVNLVSEAEAVPTTDAAAPLPDKQYGIVLDRVDDRGFNQLAWEGMQRAATELGVGVKFLQDPDPSTAGMRLKQLLNLGYDGVVTVGFPMAQATKATALDNPTIPLAIVDFPSQTNSDRGLLFSVDAPAFMAGYLAAGMSQTGTVCTYGGQQIPPVMIFMVGFEYGVTHYNEQNGANVKLLGWHTDPSLDVGGEGVFAGSFTDEAFGQTIAEEFVKQGCDIIFPVAGAVGLGTAVVAQAQGLTLIGVDADQVLSNPDYAGVYLTSVVKQVDQAVFEVVKSMVEGTYSGGANTIGTLENGGVDLAPFHSFEGKVPQALQDQLAQVRQELLAGSLFTGWPVGISRVQTSLNAGNLDFVALRNGTYQVEYTAAGTAKLAFGEYRETDDSGVETVIKLADQIAYGDLNGDGLDEAVVLLVSSPGGGAFSDLAVVADQNGTATHVASALLGDDIQLKELAVANGLVTVNLVTSAAEGAQEVVKVFEWQPENGLAELSSQVVGEEIATIAEAAPDTAIVGTPEPQLPSSVILDSLRNITYNVEHISSGPAQLVNGEYREPAGKVVVKFSDLSVLGDLNGDRIGDAAVILVSESGGSGAFVDLAVVVDQNGSPVNVATAFLGDQVKVEAMAIKSGEIMVTMLTQGEEVTKVFRLQGSQLIEQP